MGQTHGAGYGSCLGVQMGLLSADCRSQNVEDFKAMLGDSAEAYDACNTGPLPAPMNATDGWQWAGAYPYQNLDDTVGVLMQCVKNYMIGVSFIQIDDTSFLLLKSSSFQNCMQKALDTFQCSA